MAGSSWRPGDERLDGNFFTRNERAADDGYHAHTFRSSSYRDSRQQSWGQYDQARNGMTSHWQPQPQSQGQHQYFDSYYDPSYSQPQAPRRYNGPPPPGPPPPRPPPRQSQEPYQASHAGWQDSSDPRYHQHGHRGYQSSSDSWRPAPSSSDWRTYDQHPPQRPPPPYYESTAYQSSYPDQQQYDSRGYDASQVYSGHQENHREPGPSRRRPARGDRSTYTSPARERGSSSPKCSSPRPVAIRAAPRASYFQAAASKPAAFPLTAAPPPPLPLLVLDLNGTLVYRGRSGKSLQQSQNPTRRPYLSSFLAYCLGVEDQSFAPDGSSDEQDSDSKAANRRRSEWAKTDIVPGRASAVGPHGSHLWRADQDSQQLESPSDLALPPADARAKFRLFVWSSAQPINVDSMVQAILHPAQAAQLMRCWARNTLVPERLFHFKSPSIKDLEVVWNALNTDSGLSDGEKRVMADYRDSQDHLQPDTEAETSSTLPPKLNVYVPRGKRGAKVNQSPSLKAALQAEHFIKLPQQRTDKTWKSGRGYGLHNTLLLDDSQDKAKMQPYNHLFIPEFTVEKAVATQKYHLGRMKRGKQQDIDAEQQDSKPSSPPVALEDLQLEGLGRRAQQRAKATNRKDWAKYEAEQTASDSPVEVTSRAVSEDAEARAGLDTVLLQTIGVLEHARWQRNVAAWIHSGGLGFFAGMPQPGTSAVGQVEVEMNVDEAGQDGPRLETPQAARTESFWEVEGRRALERAAIPIVV